MQLKARIEGILSSLGRTKPELADGIKKWENYILKAVAKVSVVTGRDEEDILSEILLGVLKVDEMDTSEMCRCRGSNYKIIGRDGPLAVHLKTLDCNTKFRRDFWTAVSDIQPIRTGKLSSSIYREIRNQYMDLLSRNFTQKNGYVREQVGTRVSKRTGRELPVYHIVQAPYFVDFDGPLDLGEWDESPRYPSLSEVSRYLCSQNANPEESVVLSESVADLFEALSPEARHVFGYLLEDPGLSTTELAKKCRISKKEVGIVREEIMRGYELCINSSESLDAYARHFIRFGEE